jgi:hypothetical protein
MRFKITRLGKLLLLVAICVLAPSLGIALMPPNWTRGPVNVPQLRSSILLRLNRDRITGADLKAAVIGHNLDLSSEPAGGNTLRPFREQVHGNSVTNPPPNIVEVNRVDDRETDFVTGSGLEVFVGTPPVGSPSGANSHGAAPGAKNGDDFPRTASPAPFFAVSPKHNDEHDEHAPAKTPEPSTFLLFASGLASLGFLKSRIKRQK